MERVVVLAAALMAVFTYFGCKTIEEYPKCAREGSAWSCVANSVHSPREVVTVGR